MSEAPRDAETGQFTPSTDGLFGQELENAKAGFTTKPRDETAVSELEGDEAVRAASGALAERRKAADNISVTEITGAMPERDPQEARTVEQAGAEYAAARSDIARFAEGVDLSSLAEKVDEARAEAVDGDKELARHFGFELEEAKSDAKPDSKAAEGNPPADDQVDAATAAAIDATEGLDEITKRALKIPQVKAAIEEQLGKVEVASQQLATERALAQHFAIASFTEGFPELAGLPPQHLEAGLQQLAQQNPQRFQQAMGILNRVQALQASTQQALQVQARERQQQFEATVLSEDARLTEMFGGDKAAADAANAATISYLAEHGIPRNQMARMFMDNPVLSSAEARRTIWEAAEYRRIKELPKAIPKNLPPVVRPGAAQERARPGLANVAGLERQLADASGHRALRIAAQIKSAQRKARS